MFFYEKNESEVAQLGRTLCDLTPGTVACEVPYY